MRKASIKKNINNKNKLANALNILYRNKLLSSFKKLKFNISLHSHYKSKLISRMCVLIKGSHINDYQNAFKKIKYIKKNTEQNS